MENPGIAAETPRPKTKRFVIPKATVFFGIFLLVNCVVRVLLAVYPKIPTTYYDELLSLDLAKNIALHGSVTVYHQALRYTGILYPLLLAPFYAISDAVARVTAISVFSALLMTSALIPGWLLARRLLKKEWYRWAALILLAVVPDFSASMTFLPVSLYLPLLLWAVWAVYRYMEQASGETGVSRMLLLGFLTAALALTHVTGICFGIACAVYFLISVLKPKAEARRKAAVQFLLYLVSAAVPVLLVRFIFFGSPQNAMPLMAMEGRNSAAGVLHFLLSVLMLLLYFFAVCGFFPVFLPVNRVKKLSDSRCGLWMVSFIYAVCVAGYVALTFMERDDFLSYDPRIQLKFLAGAFFPFLLLFLSSLEPEGETPEQDRDSRPSGGMVLLTLFFAAFSLTLTHLPRLVLLMDSPALQLARLPGIDPETAGWLFRAVPPAAALILLGVWGLTRKKKILLALLPVLLVFEAATTVVTVDQIRLESAAEPGIIARALDIDKALGNKSGKRGLLAVSDRYSAEVRALNTYSTLDYALVTAEDLAAYRNNDTGSSVIDLSAVPLASSIPELALADTFKESRADFIITDQGNLLSPERFWDYTPEDFSDETGPRLSVFRNREPEKIALYDLTTYVPGTVIPFNAGNPELGNYVFSGFGSPEEGFTWVTAQEAMVILHPALDGLPVPMNGVLDWAAVNGSQPMTITAGDVVVYRGTIPDALNPVQFQIPLEAYDEEGRIVLRFLFPEAREPGNGDLRVLAIAFRSLVLYPMQ